MYLLLSFFSVLEGGLAAASVLISFGVVIGKLNPFQLLVMGIIETVLFTVCMHVGYVMLGVIDVGMNRIYIMEQIKTETSLQGVQYLSICLEHISE